MQSTGAPEPLHDRDVVEHFVHQYGDPLACIRELVQNSLDAGSEEVDIRVDFEPRQPLAHEPRADAELSSRSPAEAPAGSAETAAGSPSPARDDKDDGDDEDDGDNGDNEDDVGEARADAGWGAPESDGDDDGDDEDSEYPPGARGYAELVIEDRGDGMGRGAIEARLTTVFASVGDDEPQRLGRYGVGFLSVFALDPEYVVIDTSWRGEHWRIVFDRERRYTLRRRARAIYGTRVRIIIAATRAETDALRERARAATLRWCRHVAIPIRFEGELVTAPLAIDAPCSVTVRGETADLVAAHPRRGQPSSFGFYRGGLTLVEGDDGEAPGIEGVAYKASSRQIDHTLTRDAVLHDRFYLELLLEVRAVIKTRLCERVFSMLENFVWRPLPDEPEAAAAHDALGEYLYDAAIWHVRHGHVGDQRAATRAAFRSPAGLAIGIDAVTRALARRGVVFIQADRSPLTDALEDQGHLVIKMSPESPGHRLLRAVDPEGRTAAVCERYCMPLPLGDDEADRWRALSSAVAQLVVDVGGEITGVVAGHFDYLGSAIASDVAITQERFGEVSELAKVRGRGRALYSRVQLLVINADHPAVQTLATLARSEPEFAAYQYIKLLYLGARLDPEHDAAFAQFTVERRWRRRNR